MIPRYGMNVSTTTSSAIEKEKSSPTKMYRPPADEHAVDGADDELTAEKRGEVAVDFEHHADDLLLERRISHRQKPAPVFRDVVALDQQEIQVDGDDDRVHQQPGHSQHAPDTAQQQMHAALQDRRHARAKRGELLLDVIADVAEAVLFRRNQGGAGRGGGRVGRVGTGWRGRRRRLVAFGTCHAGERFTVRRRRVGGRSWRRLRRGEQFAELVDLFFREFRQAEQALLRLARIGRDVADEMFRRPVKLRHDRNDQRVAVSTTSDRTTTTAGLRESRVRPVIIRTTGSSK